MVEILNENNINGFFFFFFLQTFYMFMISHSSIKLSNFKKSSYGSKSFSINSTKFNDNLEPTLESFGQFLFTKINFS
jgi:hypothetical protein